MPIQAFLARKVTWLTTLTTAQRSFNGQYARVHKFTYNNNAKNIKKSMENDGLYQFFKDKEYVYFTTKSNIEAHTKAGELA